MARKNEGLAFGDDQEDQSTQTGEGGFGSASDHPLIQAIVQAIQAHVANGGTLEGLGDAVGPAGSPTSSTSPANGPTGPSTGATTAPVEATEAQPDQASTDLSAGENAPSGGGDAGGPGSAGAFKRGGRVRPTNRGGMTVGMRVGEPPIGRVRESRR
jgi:hypothetical protein